MRINVINVPSRPPLKSKKKITHKVEKVKRQIYPQESSLYANFHGF